VKGLSYGKWLPLTALLAAVIAGPAAANDCAVLLDTTGTLIIVTDRGTISQLFCHSLPVLSENFSKAGPEDDEGAASTSYGEGFSAAVVGEDGRAAVVARAEGNSAHPTRGVEPVAPCYVTTLSGRPISQVSPEGVEPPLYLVPPKSEVLVVTRTRSANGQLGFNTTFRWVGGTCRVDVNVTVSNLTNKTARLVTYKRFADVDLTGDFANAFDAGPGSLEARASDPDIDPATGLGANGFSREFLMTSRSSLSNPSIKNADRFRGGAYHNAIGNLLEEQNSPWPVFSDDNLLAWQPFASPGASRRSIGFGDGEDPYVFGDSVYDFEDDRVLIISHSFSDGSVPLAPAGKAGSSKYLFFQYDVR
jgi:hypothetical protein